MIVLRRGNAALPPERPAVIFHVVNDRGAWGRGFTQSLTRHFPYARPSFYYWRKENRGRLFQSNSPYQLGKACLASVGDPSDIDVFLVHLCAQRGLPGVGNQHPLQLDKLDEALGDAIRICGSLLDIGVHMPRIGTGLARGSWGEIAPLVEKHLGGFPVFVYDWDGSI